MASLFQQIKSGMLWDFHGGIHPPARKTQTSQKPLGRLNLPERLYIPLRQHIGVAGKLLVQAGDYVLKGQPLTAADNAMAVPVHAPTSGHILAIDEHPSAHPSALPEPMIVLEPDGLEQWRERQPLDPEQISRQQILARIQDAGIAGMGGAGFPTHIKSSASQGVDYLIINAAECEPYITADDMLMQTEAATIIKGIDILCDLLGPKAVLIGIEDDKPRAITAMQQACADRKDYYVRVVPAKYPSGGEKQLIQRLTSKEVPAGRRPLDIGIVMQNVGTAFAIAQAVLHDIPLISRIVTVVGETLSRPQNVLALVGTPVGFLLDSCGFVAEAKQRVIMGGPMMGFTLPSLQIPIVKTSNCIIAPTNAELPATGPELDCIRCGACAEACPATLLPQQLLWFSKAKDHDKLKEHHLSDCIECGACAYVCPSEIPLVHYYRVAKAEIREQHRDELKAEQAKARFEARNERLERDKQERMAKNQALAAQRQSMQAEQQKQQIAAAAARVEGSQEQLSKEQIIAERERKKAEARAYQAAKVQNTADTPIESSTDAAAQPVQTDQAPDPRQSAVAAAIARAKAKKAGQTVDTPDTNAAKADSAVPAVADSLSKPSSMMSEPEQAATAQTAADPRTAAVAAAIARAKAKKAGQAIDAQDATAAKDVSEVPSAVSEPLASELTGPVKPAADPRAAAVAAAIARAKAKKAAQAVDTPETNNANADSVNGTAVAEVTSETQAATLPDAMLPAAELSVSATSTSAKTTSAETISEQSSPEQSSSEQQSSDPRAAAVAAAIGRAKAKKAAQLTAELTTPVENTPPAEVSAAINLASNTDEATTNVATNPSDKAVLALDSANAPVADAKKAAIAAAIARAKAKKASDAVQEKSE